MQIIPTRKFLYTEHSSRVFKSLSGGFDLENTAGFDPILGRMMTLTRPWEALGLECHRALKMIGLLKGLLDEEDYDACRLK